MQFDVIEYVSFISLMLYARKREGGKSDRIFQSKDKSYIWEVGLIMKHWIFYEEAGFFFFKLNQP